NRLDYDIFISVLKETISAIKTDELRLSNSKAGDQAVGPSDDQTIEIEVDEREHEIGEIAQSSSQQIHNVNLSTTQGDWNRTLLLGNPAADDLVKQYLKQVTAKQLQARVTPKQAISFFANKLLLLSRHLDKKLTPLNLPASERFVISREQAYFRALFYSGDRAGDLGQLKTAEIARSLS
ncbi:hypothetical protein QZH41_005511, partial [Actinostola sp. cb2023]